MSGQHRRGLVGQGYMPKGGAKAAQAHNERVRAASPVVPPPPADGRPDARASASSGRPSARAWGVVGAASLAVGAAGLLDWVGVI